MVSRGGAKARLPASHLVAGLGGDVEMLGPDPGLGDPARHDRGEPLDGPGAQGEDLPDEASRIDGDTQVTVQRIGRRSEEHTSELQSRPHLVCRLLLEKKKRYRTVRRVGCALT